MIQRQAGHSDVWSDHASASERSCRVGIEVSLNPFAVRCATLATQLSVNDCVERLRAATQPYGYWLDRTLFGLGRTRNPVFFGRVTPTEFSIRKYDYRSDCVLGGRLDSVVATGRLAPAVDGAAITVCLAMSRFSRIALGAWFIFAIGIGLPSAIAWSASPDRGLISALTTLAGRRRARGRAEALWQFLLDTLDVRKTA
jgi:hypothetical protein